jgi:glycosyltransferase involved in cell wall biosynthesis
MQSDILDRANRARDEKRWAEAAELYARYLKIEENDFGYWVQYGHALKESGSFERAEEAYLTAKTLAASEPDIPLQLGHLFKRIRKPARAIIAFREALELDSNLREARIELERLGVTVEDPNQEYDERPAGTFIDLSDVFFYLRHHATVSGIQRVQLGIARALISLPETQRGGIRFLVGGDNNNSYAIVEDVYILEIWSQLAGEEVEHSKLKATMQKAVDATELYSPVAGDTILMLGAFWVLENIAERIGVLRRRGVFIGTLIHDIIPLSHPEFCERSLTDAFRSHFYTVAKFVDLIMTVSDYTAREVRQFLDDSNLPCPPMRTLLLAHKTWDSPRVARKLPSRVSKIITENYVLYVSTIEIRKNHTYLFRLWKRLVKERGRNAPKLVLLGRPGWRVADLLSQLESTANLEGMIKILHDVSDTALAELYRHAMFTVFPSFVEGWGLPVGESLIFGKPCLASTSSSVPEVGGVFADYIDPHNESDGYTKIVRFLDDPDHLEERSKNIRDNFRARNWSDVAENLVSIVTEFISAAGPSTRRDLVLPQIVPGRMYRIGNRNDTRDFIRSGDAEFVYSAFDTGWYPVENFGRWLRGRKGSLSFMPRAPVGSHLTIYAKLCRTPWSESMKLSLLLNGNGHDQISVDATGSTVVISFTLTTEVVELAFEATGDPGPHADPREDLCYGITAFGYSIEVDLPSRTSIVEQLMWDSPGFLQVKMSLYE